jgi:prepilin-type N-terminal cleavage/methylation domain-containing protein
MRYRSREGRRQALARMDDLEERGSMVALKNNRGFSLVETMTVIGIVAIMGTFAVPPLISWLQNKGLNSAARDLYSNMRKAQSIAVKNNRNCAISFDGDKGYSVYVDKNKSFSYDAGDEKIREVLWSQYRNVQLDKSISFAANDEDYFDENGETSKKPTVAFRPNLIPVDPGGSGNGKVVLRNSNSTAEIAVSVSGNISLKWN